MQQGIQHGASVAPAITHQLPTGPIGHASYGELLGQPYVLLSGAACVRLAAIKAVPEDIAMYVRRACATQQQLRLQERRQVQELSVLDAAAYFDCSERMIREYCQHGRLEAFKQSGCWRITGWEIIGRRRKSHRTR